MTPTLTPTALPALVPTAPQLYALAESTTCSGDQECHWCSAPCKRFYTHEEPPPLIGVRRPSTARRPGNSYVCSGCWMFRRTSITVRYLGNGYRDRRQPAKESWLLTPHKAWGLRGPQTAQHVYPILLKPPPLFALSLIHDGQENLLHTCPVNASTKWEAANPIAYSLDGTVLHYTPYELEHALRYGAEGKTIGVRSLISFFGTFPMMPPPEVAQVETGERGRRKGHNPDAKQHLKRVVTGSG